MIRVLQVVGRMGYGGAETRLMGLARCVDKSEFYFDFCVFGEEEGGYNQQILEMGFGIVKCPLTWNIAAFCRDFRKILLDGKYDVVHCHNHQFSGLPLRLASKAGVPRRIMHLRTTRDVTQGGIYRFLYRRLMSRWIREYSTHILAVSESAMESFMGPQWRTDRRTEVVYNGIDTRPFEKHYDRSETLSEFNIPGSAKVVIHVGNFGPAKDHETLIRVAAQVVEKEANCHFILVGDGALKSHIQKLVASMKLSDKVRFVGRRGDVPRLLLASDCFLFPSRWEGLPGSVLEAIAAGLPVVASDIGPVREISTVSELVQVVTPGDVSSFAKETLDALVNSSSREGRITSFPERFSFEGYANRMLSCYRDSEVREDR